MRTIYWRLSPLLFSLVLMGCTHAPIANPPPLALTAAWDHSSTGEALAPAWWEGFNSPTLTTLINEALVHSPDVLIAAQRIAQAEAQVQAAGASLFPSLNLGGGSDKRWQQGGSPRESSTASLSLSYEVDLWGKLSAERQAAAAGLAISEFDLATAQLTLTTGVARAWFELLTLEERIKINKENIDIAQRNLAIVAAKYRYGAVGVSDVYRQRSLVNSQQASLLPLQEQARQTKSALAILLGRVPQGYQLAAEPLAALSRLAINAGLPSELLQRRPDVAAAEMRLQAATANVAAARAALLPSIQLSGSGGLASQALLSLTDPSHTLALGANLSQVLFDGGRKKSQVRLSEAQQQELALQYRKTILTALQETEDALGNLALSQQQLDKQQEVVADAERALAIIDSRYRAGGEELLALLEAQRTLFSAQEQEVNLQQSQFIASLDLIKALGGGWSL